MWWASGLLSLARTANARINAWYIANASNIATAAVRVNSRRRRIEVNVPPTVLRCNDREVLDGPESLRRTVVSPIDQPLETDWSFTAGVQDVSMRDFIRLVRRRWATISIAMLLCLGVATTLTLTSPTRYRATVELFVATAAGDSTTQLAQGSTFAQARVQSYKAIVNTPPILQPVIDELRLRTTADDLAKEVTANAPINQVIMNVFVTDRDPRQAAQIANAVADHFTAYVAQIESINGESPVKLTLVRSASVPNSPASPNVLFNLLVGLLGGLVIGVGGAFLRNTLDSRIRTQQDLKDFGVPVLATIPLDKSATDQPLAVRNDPHGARAEALRQLRTNLQFLGADRRPRVIAMTSALPGEGKTTTALNLAAALAELGRRVCLLEADLRRPMIAERLGLLADIGLTTALVTDTDASQLTQRLTQNLFVLTSGPIPPNPSELLGSDRARAIIGGLSQEFDYVIVDCPPLLPVADAAAITTLVDCTILVVRAGRTTIAHVDDTKVVLDKVGVRPAGIVLNGDSGRSGLTGKGYRYYGYSPSSTPVAADLPQSERALEMLGR